MAPSLDGVHSPQHRSITPSSTAMAKVKPIRSHLSESHSSEEQLRAPQRRRSVRFEGRAETQLDGHDSHNGHHTPVPEGSLESRASNVSSALSERIAALESKLGVKGDSRTVVHRAKLRSRPTMPVVSTKVATAERTTPELGNVSPSTASSGAFSPRQNAHWSPASMASTAATSFSSPAASSLVSR